MAASGSPANPVFFADTGSFRAWLQAHHATAPELWVGFWKRATGRPSITWPEAVDQALCFGWIDGDQEARALEQAGVDVVQFDEPAFNVFMTEVQDWGIEALHRAIEGLKCKTAVHICYGYGIKANIDWKNSLGGEWRQYEKIFPALAKSKIGQVSLECINSRVPMQLMALLEGKDVLVGVIDVASDEVETPERVAQVLDEVAKYVPKEHIVACTNCGMAPMRRDIAAAKLMALGAGVALARQRYGLAS